MYFKNLFNPSIRILILALTAHKFWPNLSRSPMLLPWDPFCIYIQRYDDTQVEFHFGSQDLQLIVCPLRLEINPMWSQFAFEWEYLMVIIDKSCGQLVIQPVSQTTQLEKTKFLHPISFAVFYREGQEQSVHGLKNKYKW